MSIMQLLSSNNYITVNKLLAKEIGLEAAILLGELAAEYCYWDEQGKLENGCFFSTIENVEEQTTLTKYQQGKAIQALEELGLIECSKKGIPAKRYIKINELQVVEFFDNKKSKNLTTGGQKTELLVVKKLDSNKNNNINNNNTLNIEEKASRFTPPTLDDVTEYCNERNNNIDPQRFIDYYESRGWMIAKNKMKDWKAAIRYWEKSDYNQNGRKAESTSKNHEMTHTDDEWAEFYKAAFEKGQRI